MSEMFARVFFALCLLIVGGEFCSCAEDFQRTIVFIFAPTYPGENVFLRGGRCSVEAPKDSISQAARPSCTDTASTDPCAIAIRHRVVPTDPRSSYGQWSAGDLHLDWYGPQSGQGTYQGTVAGGTPLMWTSPKVPGASGATVVADGYGYTPYNRVGDHFWMLDVDMDCSQTENGWFEFKAFITPTVGWESNIAQYRLCAGLPSIPRPYNSINHLARCGKMNVFYRNENDCNVYNMPTDTDHTVPDTCGQRKMFADASEPETPTSSSHPMASLYGDSESGGARIVNGVPASLGRWPWQGVLEYNTQIGGCAAVLLDARWAVTAAHCVRGTSPLILKVRVGEQNIAAVQGTEQAIRASNIYLHPRYGQTPIAGEVDGDYDIALIQLMTPVDLDENYVVNTACLPRGYDLDAFVGNGQCWATGFGDTKGTSDAYRLNEIKVPVYSHADCVATWGADNISTRQVCMGTTTESACGGDSGGPLVCWADGRWNLVGITSWGTSACQGKPSVYTRISELIAWIDSVTGGIPS